MSIAIKNIIVKLNNGETLKVSYIPMDWVTIDGGW